MDKFVVGFITCICATSLTYVVSGAKGADESRSKMLIECQKDLPRSQTCVLIAVPKQETIQEK